MASTQEHGRGVIADPRETAEGPPLLPSDGTHSMWEAAPSGELFLGLKVTAFATSLDVGDA